MARRSSVGGLSFAPQHRLPRNVVKICRYGFKS